jgi:hypothetical protein
MSVSITSRPNTYSSLGNPTVYKVQRTDFVIASVDNSSGLLRIIITGDVTSDFNSGDRVFVGGTYNKVGSVLSKTFSGGSTYVVLLISYAAGTGGYANNLTTKALHHLVVFFYDGDTDIQMFDGASFKFATDQYGVCTIDAQSIRLLLDEGLIDRTFTDADWDDQSDLRHKNFYIIYQETWSSGGESGVSDSANKRLGFLSSLQIPGSNNMLGYIMGSSVGSTNSQKLTTVLTKLTAWYGYPFYFNMLSLRGETTHLLIDSVDELTINTLSTQSTVKIGRKNIDLSIGNHVLQINSASGLRTEYVLEVKESDCISPVMLVGRDTLGGIIMWLFEGGQQIEVENDEGYKKINMTCAVQALTPDQFDALHQAFAPASQIVDTEYSDMSTTLGTRRHDNKDIFILSKDGATKTQVTAVDFKASRGTRANGSTFEVTIELPYVQDL